MKMVVNKCYGGFGVSKAVAEFLELPYAFEADRYDVRLIDIIENNKMPFNGEFANLKVVEIPDCATDHYIEEYDGFEHVIYVLDGKIHWA